MKSSASKIQPATPNSPPPSTPASPPPPRRTLLVDALIRFEWLRRRYACVDTAIWENRFFEKSTRSLGEVFLAESTKICRALAAFNSVRRGFNAALKQLTDLQAKRVQSVPATNKPLNPKLASFLQFPNPDPEPAPTVAPEPEKSTDEPDPDRETPPIAA